MISILTVENPLHIILNPLKLKGGLSDKNNTKERIR